MDKHKTFISFHSEDEWAKNYLEQLNEYGDYFVNKSVQEGDIDDNLPDEKIRQIIRDDFLRDTTVTVLLVGEKTKTRKFIDWELHASMIDTDKNPKSGIVCINLPSICQTVRAPSDREKLIVSPYSNWVSFSSREEYEEKYPYMPSRIIDNISEDVDISVINWSTITSDINKFIELIDIAYKRRKSIKYKTQAKLRRRNS